MDPIPVGEHHAGQHQDRDRRTYHHVGAKRSPRYLASFAYRFNRRFQLDSIVERLAWAAAHTAPHPYRVIIADAYPAQSGNVMLRTSTAWKQA
jgi:hypothetical protein